MTNTNKKIIEGIRFIARDTQRAKIFDKIGYIRGYSAIDDLLEEARRYQERYEHEFDICESACIEYGKIDVETLRKQAEEIAEQNDDDENEVFHELFNKAIKNIDPPYSIIMEEIKNTIGYYHQIQLYDGSEWFDDSEIDTIDYDDGNFGTFTLKEDEE
nr:MAG TPA: hypothetical protein [Caudoviricetes sp.]